MKLSVWIFATDLLSHRQSLLDRLVKKNIFKEHSPKEVFKKLTFAGIDGIELLIPVNFSEYDLIFIQNILAENNIKVNTIHQPIRFFSKSNLDEIRKLFTIAQKLNAKVIVLHLSSAGNQIHDKTYIQSLHTLENQYKIRIGFENHQKHIVLAHKKYLWNNEQFSRVLKQIDFGITFDTTHLATTGSDTLSFLEKNLKNIVNIHLSDYKDHKLSTSFRPAAFTHMPLGEGQLPIMGILKLLKKERYKGFITLEINSNLEGICKSAKIVKSIID